MVCSKWRTRTIMLPALSTLSRSKLFLDIVAEAYTKSGSLSKKLPKRSKVADQLVAKHKRKRLIWILQIRVIMSSGLPRTTFIIPLYILIAANYHLYHSQLSPFRRRISVDRTPVDQTWRSWVRCPPRYKNIFFFASCGLFLS